MPCVLLIYAHPDDESFLFAGCARLMARQGFRVALATATLGEEGRLGDPPLCAREELPQQRERELRRACGILGIDDLHLLGYRDKRLSEAQPDEIRRQLTELIRLHRPEIVVTFDPNGLNLHPDHVAISRFCSDAVAAAADPRYLPQTRPAHEVQRLLWTPPLPHWEHLQPQPPWPQQPGADFVIDVREFAQDKIEALRAHESQRISIRRCFFDSPRRDLVFAIEIFRQAFGPTLIRRPMGDLLAGIG